jgi:regulator of cell morphogenesis and NO signaling
MKQSEIKINNLPSARIGDIVAGNYHAAGVFKEFGIDFCCGGGVSLKKACEKRNLDIEHVVSKLNLLQSVNESPDQNYNAWEPGYLIGHIEQTHHNFVRTKVPEITAYAAKVAGVHGERHPENVAIHEKFVELSRELLNHLETEEERVFPLIRTIFEARMSGKTIPEDVIDSLKNELHLMEEEHEGAGDVMKEIRELSNQFTPPADACRTYQILYLNLSGFEEDLHKHVHLENNILFKKAEELIAS